METVSSHVTRPAFKFHFNSQFSYNEQVKQLGQSNPIYAKHKMPRAMLADWASCVSETAFLLLLRTAALKTPVEALTGCRTTSNTDKLQTNFELGNIQCSH